MFFLRYNENNCCATICFEGSNGRTSNRQQAAGIPKSRVRQIKETPERNRTMPENRKRQFFVAAKPLLHHENESGGQFVGETFTEVRRNRNRLRIYLYFCNSFLNRVALFQSKLKEKQESFNEIILPKSASRREKCVACTPKKPSQIKVR